MKMHFHNARSKKTTRNQYIIFHSHYLCIVYHPESFSTFTSS